MDDDILRGLREDILNIPPLREPRTVGYYSKMAREMVEELEIVPSTGLKEYIRPKKKEVLVWWRRLYQWTKDFPDEFKIFLIGCMVGVVVMTVVRIVLL